MSSDDENLNLLLKLKAELTEYEEFKEEYTKDKDDKGVQDAEKEIKRINDEIKNLEGGVSAEDNSDEGDSDEDSEDGTESKKAKAKRLAKSGLKKTWKGAKWAHGKVKEGAEKSGLTDSLKNTGQKVKDTLTKEHDIDTPIKNAPKATGRGIKNFFSSFGSAAKNNPGTTRANFFFFFALIIHILDGYMNFDNTLFRIVAYMFLFFYGWLMIFKPEGTSLLDAGPAAGISGALALGAFFIPLFAVRFLDPLMSWTLVNVLRVCFPVYFIYFVIHPISPLLKWLQKAVFWFWIILFIAYFFIAIKFGTLEGVPFLNALDADIFENQDDADAGGAWISLWNFIKGSIFEFGGEFYKTITGKGNETRAFGTARLEEATGGYYKGTEENAPRQGVFITSLEFSQSEYLEGDIVEISSKIDIQTPSNSLPFKVNCRAEESMHEENIFQGDILELPEGKTIIGYKDELLPMTCSLNLPKGTYNAIFKVLYNYDTSSSLKMYFIDKERKDAMRAEGLDPLNEYGKEKNPQAIYTNGPIKLGIKQPSLPIGIEYNGELGPLIGFTIENDWGGEISTINSIYLYLPEGLSLNLEYCNQFSYISTENNMNVYKLTNPSNLGKIEDYLTINCKTKIEDKEILLGDDEVSTKQIKVITNYIFETEKSVDVRIG